MVKLAEGTREDQETIEKRFKAHGVVPNKRTVRTRITWFLANNASFGLENDSKPQSRCIPAIRATLFKAPSSPKRLPSMQAPFQVQFLGLFDFL